MLLLPLALAPTMRVKGPRLKRLIGEVLEVNEAERGNHDYSLIVKGWLPACAGKQSSIQWLVVWVIAVSSSCSLAGQSYTIPQHSY